MSGSMEQAKKRGRLTESATCLGRGLGSATRRKCRAWFTTMRCFSFPLPSERSHHDGQYTRRSSHSRSKRSSFSTTDVSSGGASSSSSGYHRHRSSHSEPSLDYLYSTATAGTHSNNTGESESDAVAADLRSFTFLELRAATDDFDNANLLGEGGFGRVYKGAIQVTSKSSSSSKMEVAVKQLNRKGAQGHKEWLAEVELLGGLAMAAHPQLVRLLGYCAEDGDDRRGMQRLLVYEYLPNKSLDDHLFRSGVAGGRHLTWPARVKIALGAARGLAYLHDDDHGRGQGDHHHHAAHGQQIIFRDFKASNVLLDAQFNPKLSDFGLARAGPPAGASHVTTAVVGTLGYAAPEYLRTGHLTCKSDVWSFGVVMLELLTGRRAVDRSRPKHEQRLVDWVRPYMAAADDTRFVQIVDPRLDGDFSVRGALKFASLASQCLVRNPKLRPRMSDLVVGLEVVLEVSAKDMPPPRPMSFGECRGHGSEALSAFCKDVLPLRVPIASR